MVKKGFLILRCLKKAGLKKKYPHKGLETIYTFLFG
jgi:hypothetical protein